MDICLTIGTNIDRSRIRRYVFHLRAFSQETQRNQSLNISENYTCIITSMYILKSQWPMKQARHEYYIHLHAVLYLLIFHFQTMTLRLYYDIMQSPCRLGFNQRAGPREGQCCMLIPSMKQMWLTYNVWKTLEERPILFSNVGIELTAFRLRQYHEHPDPLCDFTPPATETAIKGSSNARPRRQWRIGKLQLSHHSQLMPEQLSINTRMILFLPYHGSTE